MLLASSTLRKSCGEGFPAVRGMREPGNRDDSLFEPICGWVTYGDPGTDPAVEPPRYCVNLPSPSRIRVESSPM